MGIIDVVVPYDLLADLRKKIAYEHDAFKTERQILLPYVSHIEKAAAAVKEYGNQEPHLR